MTQYLPQWLGAWLDVIVPAGRILLIVLLAWLMLRITRRMMNRVARRYRLPDELAIGVRRAIAVVIWFAALLLILERMGVSPTILWTAFTGFAAVGAVAFFAAWSVLSNIFCTMLLLTTRPFRLHDHIELLENGEKPGLKGEVVDINVIHTTLREVGFDEPGTLLQVPNNMFFQRTVRRWPRGVVPMVRTPNRAASEPMPELDGGTHAPATPPAQSRTRRLPEAP